MKMSYVQLVPAVDQATRILGLLAGAAGGTATLTEISRELEINKSKGLAILNTLRRAGLVTKNERLKVYGLGPALLTLSRSLLDHTDLVHESAAYLERVARVTDSTALLGLVGGEHLFIVARRESEAGMGIAVHIGHRFPLTWGAHGKAILAALPEKQREEIMAEKPLFVHGQDHKDRVDLDELRKELEECRRAGFAHDLGVTRPGVNALCAVLVDDYSETSLADGSGSRIAACLIVVGTFSKDGAVEYGSIVAATAREMSARLGSLL